MNSFLRCIFLIVFIFSFAACATSFKKKKLPGAATSQEIDAYKKAKTLLAQGDSKKGLQILQLLTSTQPHNDVTDDAFFLKGEYYFNKKDYVQAYRNFLPIIKSDFYSPKEAKAYLKSSYCLSYNGQVDEALSLINKGLRTAQMDDSTKTQAYDLKQQIELTNGEYLQAVNSLSFLANKNVNSSAQQKAISSAKEIIQSKISPSDLSLIPRNNVQNADILAFTYLKLGEFHKNNGNMSEADTYLKKVISVAPMSDYAEKAQSLLSTEMTTATNTNMNANVDAGTIGVILPLSGKHKHIGQKTLKGIQLALGVFGESTSNFKLAIFDSKSNAALALQGAEKLINQDNVIAVIGGLLSKTSKVVSKKCNEYGVPNISLSQKSKLTEIGDYIFRNAVTGKSLIKTLVKTAMEKRNLKKFAILYPNDKYGTEYANLFWDEVRARGGEITSAQSYPPKETDFKKSVKKLVGTYYIEDRKSEYQRLLNRWHSRNKGKRKSSPDDLLPPIIDFDGLFIPDNVKALGQIAPMLNYYDVHDIILLGTNIWNQKDLIRRGQLFVEDALFVEDKSVFEKSFNKTSFYKKFSDTFSEKPNSFSAQAYDSAKLIAMIIQSGGADRETLKDRLTELKSFTGARGDVFINKQREMISPMIGLTVKNKKIKIVE